jgi:hypothetical protein
MEIAVGNSMKYTPNEELLLFGILSLYVILMRTAIKS